LDVVLHGVRTSYIFEEPGKYNITLTIKDAVGREASHSFKITVLASDQKDDDYITIISLMVILLVIALITVSVVVLRRKRSMVSIEE
jgi:subtilase family serine protease